MYIKWNNLSNDNITYLNKLKVMFQTQTIFNILHYFYNKNRENVKFTNYFTIFFFKLLMWWVIISKSKNNVNGKTKWEPIKIN